MQGDTYMEAEQPFSRLLLIYRLLQGFTPEEAAKRIRCSPSSIFRWERGETLPRSVPLQNFIEALRLNNHQAEILRRAYAKARAEAEIVTRSSHTEDRREPVRTILGESPQEKQGEEDVLLQETYQQTPGYHWEQFLLAYQELNRYAERFLTPFRSVDELTEMREHLMQSLEHADTTLQQAQIALRH